jgi:hypothetical protein
MAAEKAPMIVGTSRCCLRRYSKAGQDNNLAAARRGRLLPVLGGPPAVLSRVPLPVWCSPGVALALSEATGLNLTFLKCPIAMSLTYVIGAI